MFLRIFEYYSGILFLTTNRVGMLDEAFKSRIHLSLYYPELSRPQTLAIFEVNIKRVEEIEDANRARANADPNAPKRPPIDIYKESIMEFARIHFDSNDRKPELRWNGRQIRIDFKIAYSLAQFDTHKQMLDHEGGEGNTQQRPTGIVLNRGQFETVAEAIAQFEDYFVTATGSTDRDKARNQCIREDDYECRSFNKSASRGIGASMRWDTTLKLLQVCGLVTRSISLNRILLVINLQHTWGILHGINPSGKTLT